MVKGGFVVFGGGGVGFLAENYNGWEIVQLQQLGKVVVNNYNDWHTFQDFFRDKSWNITSLCFKYEGKPIYIEEPKSIQLNYFNLRMCVNPAYP